MVSDKKNCVVWINLEDGDVTMWYQSHKFDTDFSRDGSIKQTLELQLKCSENICKVFDNIFLAVLWEIS
jgi:hypothetical protein